jgi:RNA polymerase sigma-70 factor (ECF subfamily)
LKSQLLHNETESLKLIASGDQKEFAILIETYGPRVYSHVLTYIKDAARAEEITQDIFMNVWNHREQLPSVQNFQGYLFVLTRNRTISAFRERITRYNEALKDELETRVDPAKLLEYRELSDVLQRGMDQLPARRKEIFLLSRFGGKTYEEIAAQLKISKSAVNKNIIEALVFLRTFLRNELLFSLLVVAGNIFQ